MPRDGAIIFSDLFGKLDALRVACDKCNRAGLYQLNRLVEKRGSNAKVIGSTRSPPTARRRSPAT
jgi:hypothetical protein